MATREWKPIKEYTDILFEQYKGIAKSPSTVRRYTTLSVRSQTTKCATLSRYAADATISA